MELIYCGSWLISGLVNSFMYSRPYEKQSYLITSRVHAQQGLRDWSWWCHSTAEDFILNFSALNILNVQVVLECFRI